MQSKRASVQQAKRVLMLMLGRVTLRETTVRNQMKINILQGFNITARALGTLLRRDIHRVEEVMIPTIDAVMTGDLEIFQERVSATEVEDWEDLVGTLARGDLMDLETLVDGEVPVNQAHRDGSRIREDPAAPVDRDGREDREDQEDPVTHMDQGDHRIPCQALRFFPARWRFDDEKRTRLCCQHIPKCHNFCGGNSLSEMRLCLRAAVRKKPWPGF